MVRGAPQWKIQYKSLEKDDDSGRHDGITHERDRKREREEQYNKQSDVC